MCICICVCICRGGNIPGGELLAGKREILLGEVKISIFVFFTYIFELLNLEIKILPDLNSLIFLTLSNLIEI